MKYIKSYKIFEAKRHPVVNLSGIDLQYVADNQPIEDGDNSSYGKMIYLSKPDNYDEEPFTDEEVTKIQKAVTELGLEFGEDMGDGMIYVMGDITILDWLDDNNPEDFASRKRLTPEERSAEIKKVYGKKLSSTVGDEKIYNTIIKKYIPMAISSTDPDKLTVAGGGFLFIKQVITNAVDMWLSDNPSNMGIDEINKLEDEVKEYWRPF